MIISSIWKFCLPALLAAGIALGAESPQVWTLDKAVETAIARHFALQAAQVRKAGAEGLKMQAGLRRNPEFFLQTENWRFTGSPGFQFGQDLDLFAYVSQHIETGGKRGIRVGAAELEIKVADIEKQALEWRIRQDVRQAFMRAVLAQKLMEIVRENTSHFQQIVDYHRVRVEQGAMAEADLIKVLLEQERLALAQDSAQVDADKARMDLLRAMGIADLKPDFQLAELPGVVENNEKLDLRGLLERARLKSPEVRLGEALVERAQALVAGEKVLAKPDLNLTFGYKRTSGYDTVLAGVAVPLPLFNRNEGSIRHSQSEVDRARFLLQARLAQIEAEVNSALVGIRRRNQMLKSMESGLIQRAEESWRISLAAYQEGGTDLLRLLDAQRVRNETRQVFTKIQMEHRLGLAELESAVGEENLSLAEELLRVH